MRKESLIIFVTAIVLTLGIVGGLHYLYLQDQKMITEQAAVKSKPRDVADTPNPSHKRVNQPGVAQRILSSALKRTEQFSGRMPAVVQMRI